MLQKNNSLKLSDYFIRLMLTMIGLIMVLTITLTGVLYYNFRTASLASMQEYEKTSALADSRVLAEMTDMVEILTAQLQENPQVKTLLYALPEESASLNLSLSSVFSRQNSETFVQSLYFYNGNQDTISILSSHLESFPSAAMADKEFIQFLNNPDSFTVLSPISRSIPLSENEKKYVFTYIYYDALHPTTGLPQSAIAINIDAAWLSEQLALYQEENVNDFILNKEGILLTGQNVGADLSKEGYVKTILTSASDSGSIVDTADGKKALISYARDKASGAIFIRMKDYVSVEGQLFNFTFVILASIFIIMVIGFLIAVYLSRRLSQPLNKMADKIAHLESRNLVSQRALKQDFLNNLLSATHISSREIGMKFSDCKINISDSAPVFMILMKMDHWKKMCAEYSQADRSLMKYGVMNITEELMSEHFVCDLVDVGEDSMVILCNYPTPAPGKEEIRDVLTRINRALTTHLSISVTFCVGYVVSDISQISRLFEDTKNAITHRLFSGHGSVIFPGDISLRNSEDYLYPSAKERQLIDSLMLEKPDKVKELFGEIADGIQGFPASTATTALQRLSMAITLAVSNNHLNAHLLKESENLSTSIAEAETLSEITEAYHFFFDRISESKSEQKNRKYEDLIKTIHDLIDEGYADGNLSVNSISEEVGMSSVYLGRLYKKLTGKSINESINEVRIAEAKHLLTETNLTVNEIVDKIGFTNSSYFYTVFKKYQGIAPNDYRQKNKKTTV